MIGRIVSLSRSRPAQIAVVVVAVALMGRAANDARSDIADGFRAAGAGSYALSVACFVAGVLLAGMSWRQVLLGLGERARIVPTLGVFTISQLGKYIPGSVWVAMMSIELGHRAGLGRKQTGLGVVIASALGVVTGLIVGLPALPFAIRSTDGVPWGYLFLGAPLLLLLVPRILNWVLAAVLRLARRSPLGHELTGAQVVRIVAWIAASYTLQGLHLVVLVAAISDEPVDWVLLVSGFALAWTLGFLFLPAPAGAGVRELVLIAVLGSAVGHSTAVALAIMSRAVTLTADVLLSSSAAAMVGLGHNGRGLHTSD